MHRVAVLDDYQAIAKEYGSFNDALGHVPIDCFHDHLTSEADLVQRLKPYSIVVAMRERTPFPRSLLSQLPNLKLLITTGPFNASIDAEACKDLNIAYAGTNAPPASMVHLRQSTVETTWALILACAKNVSTEAANVRDNRWQTTVNKDLYGATLGVYGLGNIGASVAAVGKGAPEFVTAKHARIMQTAFGMKVVAWSENLTQEKTAALGVERATSLRDLAEQSDFLTIHQKLSERTRGSIRLQDLIALGPSGILINTSRGPIVCEDALIKALKDGSLGGAGLDVFDVEPLPSGHPFRYLKNVVALPHIGYGSHENYKAFFQSVTENIKAYIEEGKVLNQIA